MSTCNVLLIATPIQLMEIETKRPGLSLGELYLAGALRERGIEPELVDASVGTREDTLEETFHRHVRQENNLIRIGMSQERIRNMLTQKHYDMVCISSIFTPQTRMVFETAESVKRVSPDTLVVAGGGNARALRHHFLQSGFFDIICLTEGEKVIQEIALCVMRGQKCIGAPGTAWRDHNGGILEESARSNTFYDNLDELPRPARDLLPYDKYDDLGSRRAILGTEKRRREGSIQTSRGCPFICEFCHISLERRGRGTLSGDIGELRLKSIDRIASEFADMHSLGVTHALIEDDSFLPDESRVKEIFNVIRPMGFTFSDVNGVNLAHLYMRNTGDGKRRPNRRYMEFLFEAGLRQIVFPVESGSQRVLDKYATKKLIHERMDVLELVRIAKDIGIVCPVNMMIGFPDETKDEMMMSVNLARRLIDAGAPYVTFFIPIPFPGCRLYQTALDGRYLQPPPGDIAGFLDWTDKFNWKNGIMENTVVPPEEVATIRDCATATVNSVEHNAMREQNSAGVALQMQEFMGTRWNPGISAKTS